MTYRPKIIREVSESDYIVETEEAKFYFSSVVNKGKFLARRDDYKDLVDLQISKRFGLLVEFNNRLLYDLVTYFKTEQRGVYIETNDFGNFIDGDVLKITAKVSDIDSISS